LKNVIDKLSEEKSSVSIEKCKNILHLLSVKNDLIFIKTNFLHIVTTIKSLEKSNTSLVDMINIIENTFTQLELIPGEKREVVKTKIWQLQQKNKGYKFLKNIGQVLSGNNTVQFPENYPLIMVADLQYSPVTSNVDVEWSISILYKNILINHHTKMTPEHMEQYIVINCNL